MTRKHILALMNYFTAQNDVDLRNAVLLLGCSAALMRLPRFRHSMSNKNEKLRKDKHGLDLMCDLLSLENVADADREKCAHLAEIDPAHDAVWLICRLTKTDRDFLQGFEAISDANENEQSEVAA